MKHYFSFPYIIKPDGRVNKVTAYPLSGAVMIKTPHEYSSKKLNTLIEKNRKEIKKLYRNCRTWGEDPLQGHIHILGQKVRVNICTGVKNPTDSSRITFPYGDVGVVYNADKKVITLRLRQSKLNTSVKRKLILAVGELLNRLALKHGRKLIKRYARSIGVSYRNIRCWYTDTEWGSCTWDGNITLNWRLMLAPPEIFEYIAVHELIHRREMNHSVKFYRRLATVLPDHKRIRKELDSRGDHYDLKWYQLLTLIRDCGE